MKIFFLRKFTIRNFSRRRGLVPIQNISGNIKQNSHYNSNDKENHLQTDNLFIESLSTSSQNIETGNINSLTVSPKKSFKEVALNNKFEDDKNHLMLSEEEYLAIRLPFKSLPGPGANILNIFSATLENLNKYLSLLSVQITIHFLQGLYKANTTTKLVNNPYKYLFDNYGPLVRLGDNLLAIYKNEHIEMFNKDESNEKPSRSFADSLEAYRALKWPQAQSEVKLEKEKLIQLFNNQIDDALSKTDYYYEKIDGTADEFIERIIKIRNNINYLPQNFQKELYRWSFESIYRILFNKKLNLFSDPTCYYGVTNEGLQGAMLNNIIKISDFIRQLESGYQFWRFFPNQQWNKLSFTYSSMDGILSSIIRTNHYDLNMATSKDDVNKRDLSFLDALSLKENLTQDELSMFALDTILLCTNIVSNSTGFLLYHLGKGINFQNRLHEVVSPSNLNGSTYSDMSSYNYLNACINEIFRMYPSFSYIYYNLKEDVICDGYIVPNGTFLIIANEINLLQNESMNRAKIFDPTRWFDNQNYNLDPISTIVFWTKYKSFISQLIKLHISVLTAKLIKNFKVEYNLGEIQSSGNVLAVPNKPLVLKFDDRK